MFEDTVTVFNVIKEKDKVTYHRQFVNNVFYHKEKIISQEGKFMIKTVSENLYGDLELHNIEVTN